MLHNKWNFFGLSVAGHTQVAYSRLSEGWRPRPEGMWCDLHMWRQWLLQPWVKFQSGAMPTTLHFPSPTRQNWTMNERLDELDYWWTRVNEENFQQWLSIQILADWQRKVESPAFFKEIADTFAEQKMWGKAEEFYLKSLEMNPLNAGFHIGYIKALRLQKKIEVAFKAAERAQELFPDNTQILFLLQCSILTKNIGKLQTFDYVRR